MEMSIWSFHCNNLGDEHANVAHFASHYVDNGTDYGDSIAFGRTEDAAHILILQVHAAVIQVYGYNRARENFYMSAMMTTAYM